MATNVFVDSLQSSFKKYVESHENISCYLISKQKLFCSLFMVPLHPMLVCKI